MQIKRNTKELVERYKDEIKADRNISIEIIACVLKAIREYKGLSRSDAAAMLRMAPATLFKIECGGHKHSTEDVERLLNLYDVDHNDFIFYCTVLKEQTQIAVSLLTN